MSVNIHMSLHIENLSSLDEANAVETAVEKVLRDHSIEHEVRIFVFLDPLWVKVATDEWPVSVRGFGAWSAMFEHDVTHAVRAVAPAAAFDLEWGYPDND
ncbi:hypothetical protein [Streptomyces sp. A5-4]|uniref:hypothetical protein n=1 Tax=Streptomyces sp. A5-4 TaxID=3384771 RepID=UPI003DA8FE2C